MNSRIDFINGKRSYEVMGIDCLSSFWGEFLDIRDDSKWPLDVSMVISLANCGVSCRTTKLFGTNIVNEYLASIYILCHCLNIHRGFSWWPRSYKPSKWKNEERRCGKDGSEGITLELSCTFHTDFYRGWGVGKSLIAMDAGWVRVVFDQRGAE